MVAVSKSDFAVVLPIIKKYLDYAGEETDRSNGTAYFINRDGKKVLAAEHWYGASPKGFTNVWAVDDKIYKKFLTV